ncbi:unnamed protein product [Ambrosiozyma monospora]|uniref:Unnamed protein product n=1 Tax=Ambrosiozyma monospora TaxID=43982 RepID=A0ACB5U9H7_AMBMO|nr:unnamed protein product [Ambrosiozyma monospora]
MNPLTDRSESEGSNGKDKADQFANLKPAPIVITNGGDTFNNTFSMSSIPPITQSSASSPSVSNLQIPPRSVDVNGDNDNNSNSNSNSNSNNVNTLSPFSFDENSSANQPLLSATNSGSPSSYYPGDSKNNTPLLNGNSDD